MSYRVFIGWDSRFPEPAKIMAYTMWQHSSIPLDIRFLDLRHLRDCYEFNAPVDPRASTEFSHSRFLVPWLCGYRGTALFVDNDMLCFGDVAELFGLPMTGFALRVVQQDYAPKSDVKFGDSGTAQAAYPRKNWSSVMLMNCGKLQAWTKSVVESGNGARLHRFQDIPDEQLGKLAPRWNNLGAMTDETKILHYTEGGPYLAGCENCQDAGLWRNWRQAWLRSIGWQEDRPLVPVRLG